VNEALNCAVMLDWLVVSEINGINKTRAEHYGSKITKFAEHLRIWGEAGVVKARTIKAPKLQDRGVKMMFVGYNLNMGSDVYRIWNEETKRIHNTRDITWLHVYYNNRNDKANVIHPTPSVGENKCEVTDEDESCLEMEMAMAVMTPITITITKMRTKKTTMTKAIIL